MNGGFCPSAIEAHAGTKISKVGGKSVGSSRAGGTIRLRRRRYGQLKQAFITDTSVGEIACHEAGEP
jgi:hypothetical protein